jgi:hypothetical protein
MPTAEIRGPLRANLRNPRYFTDDSGRAIYLTGSHTWNNLQDMGKSDPPPQFDFAGYLDFLNRLNHNFVRLWAWDMLRTWDARDVVRPFPWARTGPGSALDGKPRFDLFRHDDEHFDRLRSRVAQAAGRNIYVGVMLFEAWSIFASNRTQREMHLFSRENNINGIDLLGSEADGVLRDWITLDNSEVVRAQEAYVRRVVQAVNEFDNVLYEICNEAGGHSHDWQDYFVEFVRKCEAEMPKRHPVGVTGGMGTLSDNEWLFASAADWVSPEGWGPEGELSGYLQATHTWGSAPFDRGGKVVLLDTDHLWGVGGNEAWAWKSFCRGYNVLYMDRCDDFATAFYEHERWPQRFNPDLRREMGRIRAYAERMELNAATPQNGLASTGYCLAQPGEEYLVYQPTAGPFAVELASGAYEYEWHDPSTGEAAGQGAVSVGPRAPRFTPPFEGDAVLYLERVSR